MPANRVAALAAFLTSLGALIAAVAGAFPGHYAGALVAAAALVAKLAVTLKFLDGSQKHEARQPRVGYAPTFSFTGPSTGGAVKWGLAGDDTAPQEPGDADGAPSIPTTVDPPADGNDQVHA